MSWPRARWKYDAEAVPYLPEREPGRKRAVAAEETGGSMESVHSGHDGRACDEMHATRCRGGEWEGCAGQQSKTAGPLRIGGGELAPGEAAHVLAYSCSRDYP